MSKSQWWLQGRIIAYASSHDGKANFVISKAQFDNALPKNVTEYDMPLAAIPNMDDWNVQMACVKAMLNCTSGELECVDERLLNDYIADCKRVVTAALSAAAKEQGA